ncbi:hypothetical protein [Microbulbifer mangrovi]|uniref:hypothetical protein n=1 Tax=Microbulbifer mangrovi TaxID=927787 RepID=UPI0009908144|nr:hypothetical protein [Microbulbifer mangrovi]
MAGSEKPGKRSHSDDTENKFQEESPPAADPRSRDHLSSDEPSTAHDSSELEQLMQRAEATMTLAAAWSENFTRLVQLEFQRTLSAGKRIVLFLLVLFFLAISLLVSLCAGLGLLGYYLSQSVVIGFGIFVLSQILIVVGLLLSVNSLRKMLRFEESKKQAKEALDDVTALFKQTD